MKKLVITLIILVLWTSKGISQNSNDSVTCIPNNQLRKAINLKPDFAEARFSLGLAYWMIGDRVSALEELRILKMNNPDLASTLSQKFVK